jgi:hypothetical protein
MQALQEDCSELVHFLQGSAATQSTQWPSLRGPTQNSLQDSQWCSNITQQALFFSSGSSSSRIGSSSCHVVPVQQQVRSMHSSAADVDVQPSSADAASTISTSSSRDEAGANALPKQQQQEAATFQKMGLPDELLAALKAQGISAPTPVQAAAVRPILSGRNVALQSATGTGKVRGMHR